MEVRLIMMMLLTTLCLSGCQSPNTQLVCAQIQLHEIKPVKSCDVSFVKNRCRCRCFNYNAWTELDLKKCKEFPEEDLLQKVIVKKKTGEKYQAINYPLEHCEGVTGPFLDTAAVEVRPQIKALYQLKENLCK